MADLITNTTSETLPYHESEVVLIQDITSTLSGGTYIKLSNKEYLFSDYSQVSQTETLTTPLKMGYKNNNQIISLEFSYDEE